MIACVTDIETTGPEPTDQIVEIGSYLIKDGAAPAFPFQCLVAPTIPIPPSASAVHHIIDQDLIRAAPWPQVQTAWFTKTHEAEVFVAHNAKFEMMWLGEITAPRPWICTMKCAMRAWPEAPGFSNQVLRYWRNPSRLDRRFASESHRALPDAYVTAFLFLELLSDHPLETLIAWSADIPMPPNFAFGKHKGEPWAKAPFDYLEWIAVRSDMDEDTKAYALHHMNLRRPPKPPKPLCARASTYLDMARPIIAATNSITDLAEWWRVERFHRDEYGITEGTDSYADLVALCAQRKASLSSRITQDAMA